MTRPDIDLRTSAPAGEGQEPVPARRDVAGDRRDATSDERDLAGDRRDVAGDERDLAGDERDVAGDERDHAGDRRDVAGSDRDEAAARRDLRAEQSERGQPGSATIAAAESSTLARRDAAADRKQAAEDRRADAIERSAANLDRRRARADRLAGSAERLQAEVDRGSALADRSASAVDRERASFDGLTGAYLRDAGLVELHRDVARAQRTAQPLVAAFIDIDRLKQVNDEEGHAAGDRLLVAVADVLRTRLRPYDLIIRYGGDEFVCALSGMSHADASARFDQVRVALAATPEGGSVTVGLSELEADDRVEDLLARADASLYAQRRQERGELTDAPEDTVVIHTSRST